MAEVCLLLSWERTAMTCWWLKTFGEIKLFIKQHRITTITAVLTHIPCAPTRVLHVSEQSLVNSSSLRYRKFGFMKEINRERQWLRHSQFAVTIIDFCDLHKISRKHDQVPSLIWLRVDISLQCWIINNNYWALFDHSFLTPDHMRGGGAVSQQQADRHHCKK